MHPSTSLLGLAVALLTNTRPVLAQYGVNTVDLTTTVTVYSCSSAVTGCQERSAVSIATYPASVPTVIPTLTTSYIAIPTLSTASIAAPPTVLPTFPTYGASIPVASSAIVSAVSSIHVSGSVSVAAPSTYGTSSGGSGSINNNNTMTAPSLPAALTSIIVATGYPTINLSSSSTATVTSIVVVAASSSHPASSVSPSASASASSSGATGRSSLSYGVILVWVVLSACLLS